MARAAVKDAAERLIDKDTVVIIDALNYIKGYRYELYCISKSMKTPSCVIHAATSNSKVAEWNEGRRISGKGGGDDDAAVAGESAAGRSSDGGGGGDGANSAETGPDCCHEVTTGGGGGGGGGGDGAKEMVKASVKTYASSSGEGKEEEDYSPELLAELIMRFEMPDSRSRWDKPLFTVEPHEAVPLREIAAVVQGRANGAPNMATTSQPLASSGVHDVDRVTQVSVAFSFFVFVWFGGWASIPPCQVAFALMFGTAPNI
jgi:protein KTI12